MTNRRVIRPFERILEQDRVYKGENEAQRGTGKYRDVFSNTVDIREFYSSPRCQKQVRPWWPVTLPRNAEGAQFFKTDTLTGSRLQPFQAFTRKERHTIAGTDVTKLKTSKM